MRASRAALAALLDAPAGWGEWFPGVASAKLLAAEGDVSVVELTDPLGAALVLEVVRASPERLLFAEVGRYRRGGLEGRIELEEGPPGETLVQVHVTLWAGLLRLSLRRRLEAATEQALAALAARAEGTPALAGSARRRKLLELARTAGGLELRLPGETLRLGGRQA